MSYISNLSLNNVRCFHDSQTADLRKITLLVGENSTGKSTFLGCCKAFARLSSFDDLRDPSPREVGCFDEPPFAMGGFETVTRRGEDSFSMEGHYGANCHTRCRFTFVAGGYGAPSEHEIAIHFVNENREERELTATKFMEDPEIWRLSSSDFNSDIPGSEISYRELSTWFSQSIRRGQMPYSGDPRFYRARMGEAASPDNQVAFVKLVNFLRKMPFPKEPVMVDAIDPAPISRDRTYGANPIGGWKPELGDSLSEAGRRIGLFSGIDVAERDGVHELNIKQSDRWYNIVDVGFGVSSILPLLQAMSVKPSGTMFLLQQPEGHLHPSAQACLARMMASSSHRFVIETHSDHVIDRFRICVMKGILDPKDLGIAYFEKDTDGEGSTIHNIRIDGDGNLDGEPKGYRKFFLEETKQLLGFF